MAKLDTVFHMYDLSKGETTKVTLEDIVQVVDRGINSITIVRMLANGQFSEEETLDTSTVVLDPVITTQVEALRLAGTMNEKEFAAWGMPGARKVRMPSIRRTHVSSVSDKG